MPKEEAGEERSVVGLLLDDSTKDQDQSQLFHGPSPPRFI